MNSLFIRIYLGTLTFFALALFTTIYVVNTVLPSEQLFDNSKQIEQSLSKFLANKPQSTWPQQVHPFDQILIDQDLSVIKIDQLNDSEAKRLLASSSGRITSDTKVDTAYLLYHIPDTDWVIKIQEKSMFSPDTNDILDLVLPVMLIFFTLAFGLFLLIRKLTNPVNHLVEVATKLGDGNYQTRVNTDLPKPMKKLANVFNSMAEKLQQTISEQQVLIGAIPHELRSPLGRIRFALDITRQGKSIKEIRKQIEQIDHYVDDMQNTVDEILDLNKLQTVTQVSSQHFDLCALLQQLCQSLNEDSSKNITLSCTYSGKAGGNKALIKHAVQNILLNALRHARHTITITVKNDKNINQIMIEDDGEGVSDKQKTFIFMPFSTTNKSRNRKTGGIGLGLALVKLIMQKHQGKVWVEKSDLGGARFILTWPAPEIKPN